jgi:hypothetical protein
MRLTLYRLRDEIVHTGLDGFWDRRIPGSDIPEILLAKGLNLFQLRLLVVHYEHLPQDVFELADYPFGCNLVDYGCVVAHPNV